MNAASQASTQAAVFLDRDGTLIEEVGYLDRVDRVRLFPCTAEAVRALNDAGVRVIVVSNQSGVARGLFTEATVGAVHRHIDDELAARGARVDAYYYCPHHPEGTIPEYTVACDCRKPATGLVDRAVADFAINPAASFVVGDRWLDVRLARAVGARALLVRTGYGREQESAPPGEVSADAVVDDVLAAARWIVEHLPC